MVPNRLEPAPCAQALWAFAGSIPRGGQPGRQGARREGGDRPETPSQTGWPHQQERRGPGRGPGLLAQEALDNLAARTSGVGVAVSALQPPPRWPFSSRLLIRFNRKYLYLRSHERKLF